MSKERWLPILDSYAVSDLGRVFSFNRKRYMTPFTNIKGYKQIVLVRGKKRCIFSIHRLVLSAFSRGNSVSIDHLNGIKSDNRLSNLEWVSVAENNHRSKGKVYVFKHRDTNSFVTVDNLKLFCEHNSLSRQAMYKVNSGRQTSHKGWISTKDCK